MALPKRLRMDRAAYITISGRPMLGESYAATIVGWDMADVIVNSRLSETGQHHALFGELLMIAVERLRMAGIIKRSIPRKHLEAMASNVFAILAVNGLYRPLRRAAAGRFFNLGPEPAPRLRWSTIGEYEEVVRRRERGKRSTGPRAKGLPGRRRLRLVVGARMKRRSDRQARS